MSIYTVSAVTEIVRQTLNGALPFIWVKGEVSNFSCSQAGHIYFTLKDARAQLDCVWFAGRQPKGDQRFDPLTGEVFDSPRPSIPGTMRNGMELQCAGAIDVYALRGKYQLIIDTIQVSGTGQLAVQFEERKARLAAAGYFSQARKRPLPLNPLRIALITSAQGAALHDFMEIAKDRGLGAEIRLLPVPVQGDGAAERIASAIASANKSCWPEVIVLIRGGGSLEDLWAFNEEILAQAVFESRLPVIAGIGHEIDFSLTDMTADIRAATPSHAAQLLWQPRNELWQRLDSLEFGLTKAMGSILTKKLAACNQLASGLRWLAPDKKLAAAREKQAWLQRNLHAAMKMVLDSRKEHLVSLQANISSLESSLLTSLDTRLKIAGSALSSLDPAAPLRRGYSLLFSADRLISSTQQTAPGKRITALIEDGALEMTVDKIGNAQDCSALVEKMLNTGEKA